jgi:membrane associated rhomboid family serine protease
MEHDTDPRPHPEPRTQGWVDLGAHLDRTRLTRKQVRDYALVLEARGVDYYVRREPSRNKIMVRADQLDQAMAEVGAFEHENPPRKAAFVTLDFRENTGSTLLILASLLLFHTLVAQRLPSLGLYPHAWREAGTMLAERVLDGELWRLVTALTLHADPAHVLANVVIGAAFLVPVCRELGLGLGWLFIIVAGAVGNLLNALYQGPQHASLGFSTAVFAAAGLLSGLGVVRPGEKSWRQVLVNFGAGLALLALLGFSWEENVDIGAHVFGFLAGLGVGVTGGARAVRGERPGRMADVAAGVGALALVVGSWIAAFSF